MQLHQNVQSALHALHTAEAAVTSIKTVVVNAFLIACYVSYKSGILYRQALEHHLNVWAEEAYGEGTTIPEAMFLKAEELGQSAVRSTKKAAVFIATATEKWNVASHVEGGAVTLAQIAWLAREAAIKATWFTVEGIFVYHKPQEG